MVTLTLRHSPAALSDCLDRLLRSFLALRRRPWWRARVKGGVAIVEVKRSRAGQWHPHLHVLVHGDWLDQRELSGEWLAVTGDSFIVDVRAVRMESGGNAAAYIAKYLAKVAPAEVFADPASLDEMIVALKGRRQMITFGDVHGAERDVEPVETVIADWRPVGRLDHWITLAGIGDEQARRILSSLRRSVEVQKREAPS